MYEADSVRRSGRAALAVVAATVGLTAVGSGAAVGSVATPEPAGTRLVNCREDPGALRTAIAAAAPKARLEVKGTCVGPFVIEKDLSLIGRRGAVLDGNSLSSTAPSRCCWTT
ncbi:hypothetical protein [Streptomyces sp. NBC_01264]|uniref:hypothetical protein n=1 Tax=Streptomyces sp. NBC_01264 TaxID=2903804 RepID=UPI00224DD23D|nr:hypothetical protein [Streptomyces sp. NBC_01264]MCX4784344.1 hypothetical protein [Streptomyces sp. NBC_01264]